MSSLLEVLVSRMWDEELATYLRISIAEVKSYKMYLRHTGFISLTTLRMRSPIRIPGRNFDAALTLALDNFDRTDTSDSAEQGSVPTDFADESTRSPIDIQCVQHRLFGLFERLPTDIRLLIWEEYLSQPPIFSAHIDAWEVRRGGGPLADVKLISFNQPEANIDQESRKLASTFLPQLNTLNDDRRNSEGEITFNWKTDIWWGVKSQHPEDYRWYRYSFRHWFDNNLPFRVKRLALPWDTLPWLEPADFDEWAARLITLSLHRVEEFMLVLGEKSGIGPGVVFIEPKSTSYEKFTLFEWSKLMMNRVRMTWTECEKGGPGQNLCCGGLLHELEAFATKQMERARAQAKERVQAGVPIGKDIPGADEHNAMLRNPEGWVIPKIKFVEATNLNMMRANAPPIFL